MNSKVNPDLLVGTATFDADACAAFFGVTAAEWLELDRLRLVPPKHHPGKSPTWSATFLRSCLKSEEEMQRVRLGVDAIRAGRIEIYAHPDDAVKIREFAALLAAERSSSK